MLKYSSHLSDFGFWILATFAIAVVIHYAFVKLYPYLAMRVVFQRGAKELGVNEIAHRDKPTAEFRSVVRPSPDLVYSGCVFDLSRTPLHICARVPNSYMSVSMYASNTDNFFSLNDQQIRDGEEIQLILLGPKDAHAAAFYEQAYGATVVCSPSPKGIMLLRYFYGDAAEAIKIEAIRRKTTVMPLTSSRSLSTASV